QRGSGTRALVEELLREARLAPAALPGYSDEEFTHAAVAATIAAGRADAGVGVRAAASRFGLGFVPLRSEVYWLAARGRTLASPVLARLLEALRAPAFGRLARRLTGYDVSGAGAVVTLAALRP
ncbi:MAG TPA: substrate-binding domain-containing protein, partial [Burkholderiales bacterium]|nr:substrate-binding domain-containing protein [Burkholderiales bacterium]